MKKPPSTPATVKKSAEMIAYEAKVKAQILSLEEKLKSDHRISQALARSVKGLILAMRARRIRLAVLKKWNSDSGTYPKLGPVYSANHNELAETIINLGMVLMTPSKARKAKA